MDLATIILSKIPSNLTDLEKARYIYIELARYVTFSTKFQNTTTYNFVKMLKAKVDIYHLDTLEINCVIWAQLYSQLLDAVNIKNNIIDLGHQFVEFYIDNKKFIADATYGTYTDLARIKNGDNTLAFGYSIYQNIDKKINAISINEDTKKEMDIIDEKIGYNDLKRKKLNELKEELINIKNGKINIKNLIKDINIDDDLILKIEYLFSIVDRLEDGYYESKDFIYYLETLILNNDELSNVKATELKRTNKDKTVDIIQCICVESKSGYNYYLLAPNLPIYKVDERQIYSLAFRGYTIDEKNIPGIDFPKHFVEGKTSVNLRYKLYKQAVMLNIIDLKTIDIYAEKSFMTK